jgi:antitoxin component YwqK of YwqJK toxin-antitoxin module
MDIKLFLYSIKMKLCFILLFLTTYSLSLLAQDNGFTNRAEAKNQTVNGKKEGKWFEYLADIMGDVTTDSDAAPYYSLSIYRAGKPYGIVRLYDNASRKLVIEDPYDAHGKKNGLEKQYYQSGKIEYERPYVNNKRNGILKRYYESGKLEMETVYKNDIEQETKYYDKIGNESKQ